MADTRTADIRVLLGGGSDENRVAAAHIAVGAAFLVLGGILQLLALAALRFADLFPVSYGRLEPMANLALMIGFVTISLLGGVYYVLPRLTGARLWSSDLAGMTLAALTSLTVLGLLAIPLGFGDGRQPLGLPWWLDIPLAFALFVPLIITLGTVANRTENRSYVTLWFVIGGTTWLPLLYLTHTFGDLPFLRSLTVAYSDVMFSAGFVTMFVFTVGSGLLYFSVVRELDIPLASRQLALVGFWSFGFAGAWWGAAQLLFGPAPGWVGGVTAALGLAFPVGALTNAANVSMTLEGSWRDLGPRPGILAGVSGLYLGVGVALLAGIAGFRSVAAVTSLTAFWEAIEYAALVGVAPLLVAGTSFSALRRLIGRDLFTVDRARSFVRLTVAGSVGVLVFLAAAGIVSGFSWIGGSNSAAFIDAGEGWATGIESTVETLTFVALLFAFVSLAGQISYASVVFGTITRGSATTQEILVTTGGSDE